MLRLDFRVFVGLRSRVRMLGQQGRGERFRVRRNDRLPGKYWLRSLRRGLNHPVAMLKGFIDSRQE